MRTVNKMIEKAKKLINLQLLHALRRERGAVFVLTALLIPALFGFLGVAYDVGNLYMHKARLQNVVDAAALAGGRAYMESQKKASGHIDEVDAFPGEDGRTEELYVAGGSKNREGNHPDADNAADDYIYKNLVNLGTSVKNDKYSHYALNSEGLDPRTFYRIGLYEYVPLHFLPVIIDRKEQKVRAGAVVVIENGQTTGNTLFDKLFAVENMVNLSRNVVTPQQSASLSKKPLGDDPGSFISTTFDGEIVFTSNQWDANYAQDIVQSNQMGGYVYTKAEQAYQLAHNLSIKELNAIPNMGIKSAWDNTIGIDYHVSGFLKKLTRPHIDLLEHCNNGKRNLETSKITSYKNNNNFLYYTVTSSKGTVIYYHKSKNSNDYTPCVGDYVKLEGNTYYAFQKEGSERFIFDEMGNRIVCNYDNGWSFRRKNIIDHESWTEFQYSNIVATLVSDNSEGTTYSYNYNGTIIRFTLEKIGIDFSQGLEVNSNEYSSYPVYHWDGAPGEAKLIVDGLPGDESNPLYIIYTGGGTPKIYVTKSNARPIIFCNLTTNEINEFIINNGVEFKGLIYSPYATVNNIKAGEGVKTAGGVATGGRFTGNITGKQINVQDPGASWTQKNFVVNDSDLNQLTSEILEAQEKRKNQAINLAKEYLAEWGVSIADTAWEDPSWFSKQTDDMKRQIQEAWYNARQKLWVAKGFDMPDWPWSDGGKPKDMDKPHYSDVSVSFGQKLRIINFDTEYTTHPYIDPFTKLFLIDE